MSQNEENKIKDLYLMWRHEGVEPLGAILAWSDVLLEGQLGDINREQRKAIEYVRRCSIRAIDCWSHIGHYVELQYGLDLGYRIRDAEWEPQLLSDVLDQAFSYLAEGYVRFSDRTLDVPDSLPPIKANYWLIIAIAYLIYPNPIDRPTSATFSPSITAEMWEDSTVLVRVRTKYRGHRRLEYIQDPLRHGTRLCVADFIIQQCNSQVKVCSLDNGIIEFEFTLPVWKGDLEGAT